MSNPESFTFACPACHCSLTVPVALAGIVGPCPHCRATIQAPSLPTRPVARPELSPYPSHPTHPAPHSPPTYPSPYPSPGASPVPGYSAPQSPAPAAAPSPAPSISPSLSSAETAQRGAQDPYRVEPRQLPSRQAGMEPVARRLSDSTRLRNHVPESRPRGNRVLRVLIPLAVLLIAAAVVWGVIALLRARPEASPSLHPSSPTDVLPLPSASLIGSGSASNRKKLPPPPVEPDENAPVMPPTSGTGTILPPTEADASAEPASSSAASSAPTRATLETSSIPDPSSQLDTRPPAAVESLEVLEQFLRTKTLAERLPFLETSLSAEELEDTVLAKPFPTPVSVSTSLQTTYQMERAVDVFFRVVFPGEDGTPQPCDFLVRRRGDQTPKIVAAPLLDLYGGRLASYAAKPSDNMASFQAYVTAFHTCSDEEIPDSETKFTLRLTASMEGPVLARAHIAHVSETGSMLTSDHPTLRWGSPKPCTIELVWNTRDDPNHPYLEVAKIRSFNWNP